MASTQNTHSIWMPSFAFSALKLYTHSHWRCPKKNLSILICSSTWETSFSLSNSSNWNFQMRTILLPARAAMLRTKQVNRNRVPDQIPIWREKKEYFRWNFILMSRVNTQISKLNPSHSKALHMHQCISFQTITAELHFVLVLVRKTVEPVASFCISCTW